MTAIVELTREWAILWKECNAAYTDDTPAFDRLCIKTFAEARALERRIAAMTPTGARDLVAMTWLLGSEHFYFGAHGASILRAMRRGLKALAVEARP